MNVTIEEPAEDILLFTLVGSLDIYCASTLKKTFIHKIKERKSKILIDLSNLTYIDSSGIGILLNIFTTCQKQNIPICFSGIRGIVLKVLQLTRLDHFLPTAVGTTQAMVYLREIRLTQSPSGGIRQLIVDDDHPLLYTDKMYYKRFNIDLSQTRRLANLIAQRAPVELREFNILEQQISEILKNAIKHGNKNDPQKNLHVWFTFSDIHAHLIVEDEGQGFQNIESWNEFYKNKIECYRNHDFDRMMNYLRYSTEASDENDGGNAMCAAVEYWNEGVVYSSKKNKVGVMRAYYSD